MFLLCDDKALNVMLNLCEDLRSSIARKRFDEAFHYIHILEYFMIDNTIDKECDFCEEKNEQV